MEKKVGFNQLTYFWWAWTLNRYAKSFCQSYRLLNDFAWNSFDINQMRPLWNFIHIYDKFDSSPPAEWANETNWIVDNSLCWCISTAVLMMIAITIKNCFESLRVCLKFQSRCRDVWRICCTRVAEVAFRLPQRWNRSHSTHLRIGFVCCTTAVSVGIFILKHA